MEEIGQEAASKKYQYRLNEIYHICNICGKEFNGLFQDHNHKSGQLRGRLCRHCNLMIGFAREKEDTLLAAVEYLKIWRKREKENLKKNNHWVS